MTDILTRFTFMLFLGASLVACNSSDTPPAEQADQQKEKKLTPEEYVEQASFTDLEGDTVNISEFKGEVVLIDFWETWCKPCLASFPTMQELLEEYPEDFTVLAVTPGFTDSPDDARTFKKEHDYDFHYLYDSQGLHQQLGVQGIPYKVFVDAEGEFIQRSMGSHGPQEDYKMIKQIIEEHKDTTRTQSQG